MHFVVHNLNLRKAIVLNEVFKFIYSTFFSLTRGTRVVKLLGTIQR